AEAALNQVDAPKWVGLTATPYRADQLNGLITMQCGPIRFNMSKTTPEEATPDSVSGSTPPSSHSPRRTLQVHRTEFTTDAPGSGGPSMPDLYTELAADEKRTALIIEEVIAAAHKQRHILVLTNRIDHLHRLATGIAEKVPKSFPVLQLHGRLKTEARAQQRKLLTEAVESTDSFVLIAVDKIAGEGFDIPALDTLFLTMPVSFKGRIVQNL